MDGSDDTGTLVYQRAQAILYSHTVISFLRTRGLAIVTDCIQYCGFGEILPESNRHVPEGYDSFIQNVTYASTSRHTDLYCRFYNHETYLFKSAPRAKTFNLFKSVFLHRFVKSQLLKKKYASNPHRRQQQITCIPTKLTSLSKHVSGSEKSVYSEPHNSQCVAPETDIHFCKHSKWTYSTVPVHLHTLTRLSGS